MIIEKGVEMKGVCANLKTILKIVHLVFYEAGNHLIIIGSIRGCDKHREAHEKGQAVDIKKPLRDCTKILYKLKGTLGLNFLVKTEKGCMHIEYSPVLTIPNRKENNP